MAAVRPLDRSYLDYNATAPLRPEAREAALAAMETTGNPSSVHAEGRAARRIVEDARSDVARLAGVSSRCVTFVSGGTEAANSALNPFFGARARRGPARAADRRGGRACLRLVRTSVSRGGNRASHARRTPRSRLARGRLPPSRTSVAGAAGREQRNGRRPAGRRGGGARPCRGRLRLLRRRADGRADQLATSPRSARTRSCSRPTKSADRRA